MLDSIVSVLNLLPPLAEGASAQYASSQLNMPFPQLKH